MVVMIREEFFEEIVLGHKRDVLRSKRETFKLDDLWIETFKESIITN